MVNALIHRDYSIVGSEIHIDIYDDRLEIHSPGGMYNGEFIQEQDIFQLSSVRRNPILADMFEKIGLMERRGSGLRKIIDQYSTQQNYNNELAPKFLSTDSSFIVVLKNLNYEKFYKNNILVTLKNEIDFAKSLDENDSIFVTRYEKVKDNLKKTFLLIAQDKDIKTEEIAKQLNVTERTVRRYIAKLKENGLID
ncbi:ATP-binding protein [Mycoplasma mycoides]|uniref:ATP-binding protein n=1 Tax=Mycoplasma mycoides TaxID=2102 RepID=UPI00223FFABD|nr:ATP-binding protein [Mycoplasma mycoides]